MVVEVVVEEVTMIDFLSNDGNNCELVRMVAVEEVEQVVADDFWVYG